MRTAILAATAVFGGCTLLVNTDGLSSGSVGVDAGSTLDSASTASDGASAIDAASDALSAPPPIVVLQHHVCTYATLPKTLPCAFPVGNIAGNALLVHFYFNYPEASVVANTVTDDNGNTYAFLDVGDEACPAAKLPGGVCCTTTSGTSACHGWALATNANGVTKNPPTITVTVNSSATATLVMGAHILEISGLADAPLDRGLSMLLNPGSVIQTPTLTTATAAELVVAGVAFYTSTSVLTPPAGWGADQDDGYFAATMFRTAGAAETSYGGNAMGAITGMTKAGTSTIFALKGR